MTLATSAQTGGFTMRTGLDGEIVVTPAPGFRGTTSFVYAVAGDPEHPATATITGATPYRSRARTD
jgi:hypothetical protein